VPHHCIDVWLSKRQVFMFSVPVPDGLGLKAPPIAFCDRSIADNCTGRIYDTSARLPPADIEQLVKPLFVTYVSSMLEQLCHDAEHDVPTGIAELPSVGTRCIESLVRIDRARHRDTRILQHWINLCHAMQVVTADDMKALWYYTTVSLSTQCSHIERLWIPSFGHEWLFDYGQGFLYMPKSNKVTIVLSGKKPMVMSLDQLVAEYECPSVLFPAQSRDMRLWFAALRLHENRAALRRHFAALFDSPHFAALSTLTDFDLETIADEVSNGDDSDDTSSITLRDRI
jgi:hypothetical protein